MIAQVFVGGSFAQLAIVAIIIAAVVAIAVVVIRQMGITVPAWFLNVLWIVAAAVIGIVAIRWLMAMA
jgi:hypothetical protein